MLILFNKYVNTIIYIFIHIVALLLAVVLPAPGAWASWLAVVLPPSGVVLHGWLSCSRLRVCGAS